MLYIKKDGESKRAIIALHGTGGNASQLYRQAKFIDESATYIGIEGDVLEGDLKRYFKRFNDGTFDRKSLAQATSTLYELLNKIIVSEQLEDYELVILGYSNGANLALNLFREFKTNITAAILLHPSLVKSDHQEYVHPGMDIFISSGDNDPFVSKNELAQVIHELKLSDYNVTNFHHANGHSVTEDELESAKAFYQKNIKE